MRLNLVGVLVGLRPSTQWLVGVVGSSSSAIVEGIFQATRSPVAECSVVVEATRSPVWALLALFTMLGIVHSAGPPTYLPTGPCPRGSGTGDPAQVALLVFRFRFLLPLPLPTIGSETVSVQRWTNTWGLG